MASTSRVFPQSTGVTTEPDPPVEENDELWTKYLELAHSVDQRAIEDWGKIVDVILVYIALFTSVLTAFCIETIRAFQPNPGDVTNQILIAIYKQTMNASSPIDLDKYLRLDEDTQKDVYFRNLILYSSLVFALIIAALATMARIWVIRQGRKMNTPGLGSPRSHVMKRQEMYDGSRSWKLGEFIESLPVLTLIDVVLFGLFIIDSIGARDKTIGFIVTNVFQLGLCYLSIVSFAAAFIPNSPFRSSYSHLIKYIFCIIPNYRFNLMGKQDIRLRTIGIILISLGVLAAIGYLVPHSNPQYVVLIYFPTTALFALMRKGEKKDIQLRHSLPFCTFVAVFFSYIVFAIATLFNSCPQIFYSFFIFGTFLFVVFGSILNKFSGIEPATTAVKAVAWMLQTSSSPNPAWFGKAAQIAGESQHCCAQLLELLLPLAEPLIIHTSGDVQGTTALQEEYLRCLQNLITKLDRREGKFWHNEAPIPSKTLRRKLEELKEVECPQTRDGNVRHVVEGCPLCGIGRVAKHALERFETTGKFAWVCAE